MIINYILSWFMLVILLLWTLTFIRIFLLQSLLMLECTYGIQFWILLHATGILFWAKHVIIHNCLGISEEDWSVELGWDICVKTDTYHILVVWELSIGISPSYEDGKGNFDPLRRWCVYLVLMERAVNHHKIVFYKKVR